MLLLSITLIFCFLFTVLVLAQLKQVKIKSKLISSPKISFIIPVHNEDFTVKSSVLSALNQVGIELKNIVIILDNCTDDSKKICEDLAKKHKQLIIILRNRSPSKTESILLGIKYIQTDLVALLDADTILDCDAVQKTCSMTKYQNTDFGTCVIDPANSNSLKYGVISCDKILRQRVLQVGRAQLNCANLPGCFYVANSKWLTNNISNSFVEDLTLSYKLIKEGKKVSVFPQVLAVEYDRSQLRTFSLQKIRWTIGNLSSLKQFFGAFENKSLKTWFGLFSLPLLWYFVHYYIFILIILSIFLLEAQIALILLLLFYLITLLIAHASFSKLTLKKVIFSLLYMFTAAIVYSFALFVAIFLIAKKGFFFYESSLFKKKIGKGVLK